MFKICFRANLSESYFTNRQDRYIQFRNSPQMTNYLADIVKSMASFSFHLHSDNTIVYPEYSPHPYEGKINPFPNSSFSDRPKFKEAADDNWNVVNKGSWDTDCMENIVEKVEIAHFEQFPFFPQCFPKAFFFNVLKWVYMEERVKNPRLGNVCLVVWVYCLPMLNNNSVISLIVISPIDLI